MKVLILGVMSLVLASCNGGGGGSSSGGGVSTGGSTPVSPALSHNQLVEIFVSDLNMDPEFDVEVVKSTTEQTDFFVIFDPLTGTFDAIDLFGFDPDFDSAVDFYFDFATDNFFGLDAFDEGSTTVYIDPSSGLRFEKTTASAKDLAKIVALKEAVQIGKTAEFLSSEFGLSLNRGKEIASLQAHWKKASKKGMTDSEINAFSTELLGFSLSSGISAYNQASSGNASELEALVEQSANVNGITPEHATQLMTKVFGL